jgi:hypothetical protein
MNTENSTALAMTTASEPSSPRGSFHQAYFWAFSLLLAFGLGCGRGSTVQTPNGEVKIDKSKDEIVVKSKEGEFKVKQKGDQSTYEATTKDGTVKVTAGGDNVKLPDNFPKDIPIYKGAKIQMSSSQPKASLVHFVVDASVADAAKFYQDELKKQGWEIETSMNMNDTSMLSAKKDKQNCTVVVVKQDKGAMIQLTVENKE